MGYVGMLLLGMMFLSVGLFTSTLTGYQLLAALLGIALLGGFVLGTHAMMIYAPAPLNELGAEIDAMRRFSQFARGILDTRSVVYFLSIAALMLFLSVKTLESRRWR
jgi:ABC-2 type transport system permease protein